MHPVARPEQLKHAVGLLLIGGVEMFAAPSVTQKSLYCCSAVVLHDVV
jgi:hypothetical protein